MTTETNEDIWFHKFSPIINPVGKGGYAIDDDQYMFDNFGVDLQRVLQALKANYKCIWTLAKSENGNQYIVPGFHSSIGIGYFITEKPAEMGNKNYLFLTDEELDG